MTGDRMMAEANSKSSPRGEAAGWQLNRQVNLSVLVQLVFLASLIVGSWVNLQRQLDLLQRDVALLLQCQENIRQKLETLTEKSISHEYRLQTLERTVTKVDVKNGTFRP